MRHPAKFSDNILGVLFTMLDPDSLVLDPFAGTGRIHELPYRTVGVELEPEWATMHPHTIVANALKLPFRSESFDAVITSPVYGNRMSDHHDAKDGSRRHTYKHALERDLHPDNAGQLQWGPKYRRFHVYAWEEVTRTLRVGGKLVLNISDHYRNFELMPVVDWHFDALSRLGLTWELAIEIPTPRLKHGENSSSRPEVEVVGVFRKEHDHAQRTQRWPL